MDIDEAGTASFLIFDLQYYRRNEVIITPAFYEKS